METLVLSVTLHCVGTGKDTSRSLAGGSCAGSWQLSTAQLWSPLQMSVTREVLGPEGEPTQAPPPGPQCTTHLERAFCEVTTFGGFLQWALIQFDWYP